MAYKIIEECSSCGACESECPVSAISPGDVTYVINSNVCCECVGYHDAPQCASVCPTESCQPDPAHKETEEQLLAKAKKAHPERNFSGTIPSHFRK
jgi:ferredoxin